MSETIVSDLRRESESWVNCTSDDLGGLPDIRGATIVDVFVSRNEVTLYALGRNGAQSLAVFVIEDQEIRQKVVSAMHPGVDVLSALRAAI